MAGGTSFISEDASVVLLEKLLFNLDETENQAPSMFGLDCWKVWFGLRLYFPVNNFSVMSGRSHRFLGITSTFLEVNVSCSRIQHGDLSEDRTPTSRSEVRLSTSRPPRLLLLEGHKANFWKDIKLKPSPTIL